MNIVDGSIPIKGANGYSHIKVESEGDPGTFHYVQVNDATGTVEKCDCPSFGHRPGPCKHMRAVVEQRLLQRGS